MIVDFPSMRIVLEYVQLDLEKELNFVPKEKAEEIRNAVAEVEKAYLKATPIKH